MWGRCDALRPVRMEPARREAASRGGATAWDRGGGSGRAPGGRRPLTGVILHFRSTGPFHFSLRQPRSGARARPRPTTPWRGRSPAGPRRSGPGTSRLFWLLAPATHPASEEPRKWKGITDGKGAPTCAAGQEGRWMVQPRGAEHASLGVSRARSWIFRGSPHRTSARRRAA